MHRCTYECVLFGYVGVFMHVTKEFSVFERREEQAGIQEGQILNEELQRKVNLRLEKEITSQ